MTKLNDVCLSGASREEIESLRQQLADSRNQVKLLRDAVIECLAATEPKEQGK